ncbi:MAG: metalloregulator ArsR/SmtB family transcription factor [Pseudomonadota bacterium]
MRSVSDPAAACLEAFDDPGLRALCDPARIEVVRRLIAVGEADIGEIADGLPQHRSVISRHLSQLSDAGVCDASREGRRVLYRLDGPEIVSRVERLLTAARALSALCCPPQNPGKGTDR